jgi:hypothetical protein
MNNHGTIWFQYIPIDAVFRLGRRGTDAEGVEHRWANVNIWGPPVKEMGAGARRDTLDDLVIQRPGKAEGKP